MLKQIKKMTGTGNYTKFTSLTSKERNGVTNFSALDLYIF